MDNAKSLTRIDANFREWTRSFGIRVICGHSFKFVFQKLLVVTTLLNEQELGGGQQSLGVAFFTSQR